jgi:hypothetical protein
MIKPANVSIKDRYFVLGWSLEDTKKVERYTLALRQIYGKAEFSELYTKLADIMINLVDKKHNDHHSATAELGHDWLKVEPLNNPNFESDMVTFQGLNKLLKIYFGSASGVFKWVGRGTAAGTPTPYSTALVTETGTRLDSSTAGFHEVKGSSLRIFASFATTVATATMQQIGIFDAVTTGMMLAIHDFGGTGYTHTINVDSFSLGAVIDFVPFGDV